MKVQSGISKTVTFFWMVLSMGPALSWAGDDWVDRMTDVELEPILARIQKAEQGSIVEETQSVINALRDGYGGFSSPELLKEFESQRDQASARYDQLKANQAKLENSAYERKSSLMRSASMRCTPQEIAIVQSSRRFTESVRDAYGAQVESPYQSWIGTSDDSVDRAAYSVRTAIQAQVRAQIHVRYYEAVIQAGQSGGRYDRRDQEILNERKSQLLTTQKELEQARPALKESVRKRVRISHLEKCEGI